MREMKDSGIEWIGEIPAEWKIVKVKYNFTNKKVIVGVLADDYERLALTMNGVIKRSKEDNNGLQPEKFETYQVLNEGELVFKLIDLQNISTSRVGLSPFNGLVSPAYIIIKRNGEVLSEFAEKFFLSMWKNQIFNAMGDSGVRSSLNTKDLLEIQMVFPAETEQKAIADYIDSKCAELNFLISDIQSQIEALEEYKRSVITEAVTKGLDPDVEMRDSGVDYIGKMNAKWKLTKLRYICEKLNRYFTSDAEPLICSNKGEVFPRGENSFGLVSDNDKMFQGVHKGDLLIHGMDTWHGAIAVSDYDGKCTTVVHVCDSEQNKYFISYFLQMLAFKSVYKAISNGVRENTSDFRSWDKAGHIYITIPDIDEQNRIAEYIKEKVEHINAVIAEKKQQIETIEEYKKSLIFEYVTGKKEVQA